MEGFKKTNIAEHVFTEAPEQRNKEERFHAGRWGLQVSRAVSSGQLGLL